MLNEKVQTALNEQLNREFFSSYIYLAMSAYMEEINMSGSAQWMKIQTQEELIHCMKFYEYILSRQGRVVLKEIETPPAEWKSMTDVFESALKHEEFISESINNLVKLCRDESDNATETFLQWFVQEQVEEEASFHTILDKIKLIGDTGSALYLLDQELSSRPAPAPAAVQA